MRPEPLKICLIKHTTYPDNVRTRKEAEALVGRGHVVDVICLEENRSTARHEVIGGVGVYRVAMQHQRKGVGRYLYEYLAALVLFGWTLTRLHLGKRYDVVQIANMPDFHIFAACLAKLLGAKVVANMHECMPEIYQVKYNLAEHHPAIGLLRWVERCCLAFADHVITCNEEMTRIFVARGARAEKFSAFLNTPERDRFIDMPVAARREDDAFVLITHGSVEERYGIDAAVKAVAILRNQIPNVRLEIFGKGTALGELKRLADQLELGEAVVFRGFAPQEQLAEALGRADVGLVTIVQNSATSWVHTFKMFEYISVGTPVIVSRSKAVQDYFSADCVAYFDRNDPHDLARAALEIYHDRERGRGRARNAARVYDSVKWSVQSAEYCRLIERLAWPGGELQPAT